MRWAAFVFEGRLLFYGGGHFLKNVVTFAKKCVSLRPETHNTQGNGSNCNKAEESHSKPASVQAGDESLYPKWSRPRGNETNSRQVWFPIRKTHIR